MEETIKIFRRKLKEHNILLDDEKEKKLRLKIQKILNDFLKKEITLNR